VLSCVVSGVEVRLVSRQAASWTCVVDSRAEVKSNETIVADPSGRRRSDLGRLSVPGRPRTNSHDVVSDKYFLIHFGRKSNWFFFFAPNLRDVPCQGVALRRGPIAIVFDVLASSCLCVGTLGQCANAGPPRYSLTPSSGSYVRPGLRLDFNAVVM